MLWWAHQRVSRLRSLPIFRHMSGICGKATWLTILRKSSQYSKWLLFSQRSSNYSWGFSHWLEAQVSKYSKRKFQEILPKENVSPSHHLPSNTPQNSALWRILDQHLHLQIFRFSKELWNLNLWIFRFSRNFNHQNSSSQVYFQLRRVLGDENTNSSV